MPTTNQEQLIPVVEAFQKFSLRLVPALTRLAAAAVEAAVSEDIEKVTVSLQDLLDVAEVANTAYVTAAQRLMELSADAIEG